MQIYAVGGSVRDELLNIKNNDCDFVVVGGNTQQMLKLGYKQIGKNFPVFLHPQSGDEYALARTERKIAKGYKGFEFNTKNITLKQDLSRRDLTINALAKDKNGNIIDYFGGIKDIKNKTLKHINNHFNEDPVRILRVARFAAKFKSLGFKVSASTIKLMQEMIINNEANNLVAERVFSELDKALSYNTPSAFFQTLCECNAYNVIFNLKNNNFSSLDNLNVDNIYKFSLWLINQSQEEINSVCKKIKSKKKYQELATISAKWHNFAKNFKHATDGEKLNFYLATDAFRKNNRFKQLLEVFRLLNIDTKQIIKIWQKLQNINIQKLDQTNLIKEIYQQRLKVINNYI